MDAKTERIYRNSVETIDRLQDAHSGDHIATCVFLQLSLALVLLFIEIVIVALGGIGSILLRLSALLPIASIPLLFRVVKHRYRGILIVIGTSLAASLLASNFLFGEARLIPRDFRIIEPIFVLTYLSYTTVTLPWALGMQMLLGAVLAFVGFCLFVLSNASRSDVYLEVFLSTIKVNGLELLLLCVAIISSIIVAALVQRHRLVYLSKFLSDLGQYSSAAKTRHGTKVGDVIAGIGKIPSDSRFGFEAKRIERMVLVLLVLITMSSLVFVVLLGDVSYMRAGVAMLWLFWGGLFLLSKRDVPRSHIGYFGALLALLLLLLAGGMTFYLFSKQQVWGVVPIGLVACIGLIPWAISELAPLIIAGLLVGLNFVHVGGYGLMGVSFFTATCIFMVLLSMVSYGSIRERYLLTEFSRSIVHCRAAEEFLRVLADYLTTLFSSHGALVSKGTGHLEVVRDARAYVLNGMEWPIDRRNPESDAPVDGEFSVNIRVLDWLPSPLEFFDRRFGVFFANHGILIELNVPGFLQTETIFPADMPGKMELNRSALVFVALRMPIAKFIQRSHLNLARALGDQVSLGFEYLYEKYLRSASERRARNSAADHSYEMSLLVHEINNSIQDVISSCEMALEDCSVDFKSERKSRDERDEKKKASNVVSYLRRIGVTARTMATVVSDIEREREFEKKEGLSPREFVDLRQVMQDSLSFARIRAQRRRIMVEVDLGGQEDVWVRVSSRDHLETAVRTLLNNGIAYSKPSSTLSVALRYSDAWVWMDFTDTGPGFSKEEAKSILSYGAASSGTGRATGDSSLWRCRCFAEAQGGGLDVSSGGAGKGSTFVLTLPRGSKPASVDAVTDEKPWALMIDDEQAVTQSYARIARAFNLVPVIAHTIAAAREAIDTGKRPAFVITDLRVGEDGDGYEMVRLLREKYGLALPILVVSGSSDFDFGDDIEKLGKTQFVSKPIGQRELYEKIQLLVHERI